MKLTTTIALGGKSLKIECIGELTLAGYHTKWYRNYKTAVSTHKDSEVKNNRTTEEW
jgi:hypothetical protein